MNIFLIIKAGEFCYRMVIITHLNMLVIITNYFFIFALDILFSSNHNIHKSTCDLSFWASDPLIDRF